MGLFAFLKRKKKKAETAAEPKVDLKSVDLSEPADLDTRYTPEYQAYLAEQEAARLRAEAEAEAAAANRAVPSDAGTAPEAPEDAAAPAADPETPPEDYVGEGV